MSEGCGCGEGGSIPAHGGPQLEPTCETYGDRIRFTVPLNPNDTTIVSWKKLMKEANLASGSDTTSSGPSPMEAEELPASESQPRANEEGPSSSPSAKQPAAETAGSSHLSEGGRSSDETDTDLVNVPNDDEYDTDDSFIDDSELAGTLYEFVKREVCLVKRGNPENIEPTKSAIPQEKKRRCNDLEKGSGLVKDGHKLNKHAKTGNSAEASMMQSKHGEDIQLRASSADTKLEEDPSTMLYSDPSKKDKAIDQQISGDLSPKGKENAELLETSTQESSDKSSHENEGPSSGSRTTVIEEAFNELEKTIAEFGPPTTEVQDPDNSSQAAKKRLSPEIKEKLAKVADLTRGSDGKVPKDMINRLMGIVGHLMLVRTLKTFFEENQYVVAQRNTSLKSLD